MEQDTEREALIGKITELLREQPFTFEFKVKEKPEGTKIIYELTLEELNAIIGDVQIH